MRAEDIMTREVTTVAEESTVEELINLFRVSHYTGVPVVDDAGVAVGVISETDILRALAYTISPPTSGEFQVKFKSRDCGASAQLLKGTTHTDIQAASIMRDLLQRKVRDLMSPAVHACRPDTSLAEVCETMIWKHIHRVVVVDEAGLVVGLISAFDAMRSYGSLLRETE